MISARLFRLVPARVSALGAANRNDQRFPLVTASFAGADVDEFLDGFNHTRRRIARTRYRIGLTTVLPAMVALLLDDVFAGVPVFGWRATVEVFFLLVGFGRDVGLETDGFGFGCLGLSDRHNGLTRAAREQEAAKGCDERELGCKLSHDLNSPFQVAIRVERLVRVYGSCGPRCLVRGFISRVRRFGQELFSVGAGPSISCGLIH